MTKEYIEREALLEEFRLRVNQHLNENSDRGDAIAAAFFRMMNSPVMAYPVRLHPVTDKVKVVRCGQCRYCDTADCPMNGTSGRCSVDDYCSYGERKDGADNAAD